VTFVARDDVARQTRGWLRLGVNAVIVEPPFVGESRQVLAQQVQIDHDVHVVYLEPDRLVRELANLSVMFDPHRLGQRLIGLEEELVLPMAQL
jgi:hypothetical protein